MLIELFFAVINELYTLSSAWTLRRTLLNAAKTFLLRPGNPQLASITTLLQETLDSSPSDEGLVERGMPTALTSVMGQAASGEALGRVFDCLQEPRVARGVMFGLVLQGLRAVTQ